MNQAINSILIFYVGKYWSTLRCQLLIWLNSVHLLGIVYNLREVFNINRTGRGGRGTELQ